MELLPVSPPTGEISVLVAQDEDTLELPDDRWDALLALQEIPNATPFAAPFVAGARGCPRRYEAMRTAVAVARRTRVAMGRR